jgi:hypothetical protein
MNKLLLLFLALIFGTVFNVLPNWDGVTFMTPDPFYFYDFGKDYGIAYQTYIYMICEYFVAMIFTWIIAAEAKEYKGAIQIFFWLVVVDLLDYLLTYNSIWFRVYSFPISMNILKVFIFGLVISREWIKTQSDTY